MRRLRRLALLTAILVLIFATTARSDEPTVHPLMHPDQATLDQWVSDYQAAPEVSVSPRLAASLASSIDLTDYLAWDSSNMSKRDQGDCGNCWAWSGTGVMEVALGVQNGITDRLSEQFITSCGSGSYDCACCGGWLSHLVSFYSSKGYAVPWSNSGASWQDSSRSCNSTTYTCPTTAQSCSGISTSSKYTISSISLETITTQGQSLDSTAINNIKSVLNDGKAVWFGFFMPKAANWTTFNTFWNNEAESDVWTPPDFSGQTWVSGAGHAVLCVGYDSDSWIMLNSWGTTTDRPNGLFRVSMDDLDYSATYVYGGYSYYAFYFQTLDVTFSTITNDDFDDAIVVSQPVYEYTEDTTGATAASDDPSVTKGTCGSYFSGKGGRSVWYDYTPSASQTLTVTTANSSYDTVLAVWTGTRGSLSLASCSDDIDTDTSQSRTTLSVSAGTTYHIEVMDWSTSGSGGTLDFAMRPEMAERNDLPIIMKED